VDSSIESRCATQPAADSPANLLKRCAFRAGRSLLRATNTLEPPGLDMDGMSNEKRKFSFETL
jgi:hypothetical protein